MSIVAIEAEPHTPPAFDGAPYEFSADIFLAMIEAGFFPEQARVYLEDGRICEKMAKTRPHWVVGGMIHEALIRRVPPGWKVISEGEFKLDRTNAALPDLAVVRGDDFPSLLNRSDESQRDEIGLAIEISVTSLAKDLGSNLSRYALAMIPAYWVADVVGRRLLAHTGPMIVEGRGEYEYVEIVEPGGSVALILDGIEVIRVAYEELMP